jgi:hypothetical protein
MGFFDRRRDSRQKESTTASPWFTSRPETKTALYTGPSDRNLPSNIVSMMEQFGRFEFDPMGTGIIDAGSVWGSLIAPLMPYAQSDTTGFLRALADAVLPAGGWAVYGGERLVKEVLSGDLDDPSYAAMLTAALNFLRECGVPNTRLNGYEWSFWQRTKGRTEPWLYARPAP